VSKNTRKYAAKKQKKSIQSRGNAFCLGATNCIGSSFFDPKMVEKVAASIFSDIEPFN